PATRPREQRGDGSAARVRGPLQVPLRAAPEASRRARGPDRLGGGRRLHARSRWTRQSDRRVACRAGGWWPKKSLKGPPVSTPPAPHEPAARDAAPRDPYQLATREAAPVAAATAPTYAPGSSPVAAVTDTVT